MFWLGISGPRGVWSSGGGNEWEAAGVLRLRCRSPSWALSMAHSCRCFGQGIAMLEIVFQTSALVEWLNEFTDVLNHASQQASNYDRLLLYVSPVQAIRKYLRNQLRLSDSWFWWTGNMAQASHWSIHSESISPVETIARLASAFCVLIVSLYVAIVSTVAPATSAARVAIAPILATC